MVVEGANVVFWNRHYVCLDIIGSRRRTRSRISNMRSSNRSRRNNSRRDTSDRSSNSNSDNSGERRSSKMRSNRSNMKSSTAGSRRNVDAGIRWSMKAS